jgi:hypothetical protein
MEDLRRHAPEPTTFEARIQTLRSRGLCGEQMGRFGELDPALVGRDAVLYPQDIPRELEEHPC